MQIRQLLFLTLCSTYFLNYANSMTQKMQRHITNFKSDLELEMNNFTSSNEILEEKIKPFGAEIESEKAVVINIPENSMNFISKVSDNELTQIVLKYSSSTRRQQNCLKIREFLEILPSTPSYYSSFWSFNWNPFSSSDPHEEMKSYRTMAYNILKSVKYKDSSMIREVSLIVDELQDIKKFYFHNYYKKNVKEMKKKKKEAEDASKEIMKLSQQKTIIITEMKTLKAQIKHYYDAIKEYVEIDNEKKNGVQSKINIIDYFRDISNKVQIAGNGNDIDQIIKKTGNPKGFYDLKDQLQLAGDFKQLIESLTYLLNSGNLIGTKQNLIADQIKKLKNDLKNLNKEIEKTKKVYIKVYEKRIQELEKEIKNDVNFKKYKATITHLITLKKDLNKKKSKINNIKFKIEQKHLSLETFNIEEYSDFVIPSHVLFDLKEKLEQLKKIYTFDGLETLENRKKNDRNPDSDFNKLSSQLTKAQTFIKSQLSENVNNVIQNTADQLFIIAKIEDLEKDLDEKLGYIFAEIFEMEGNRRCFTISQVSYFFFSMFKTNTISNQHRFLINFLSNIKFSQAKEFVIYNYSLFSTKEFINNFERSYDTTHAAPNEVFALEEAYISQFAVNFISVIDLYKDMTEFKLNIVNFRFFFIKIFF